MAVDDRERAATPIGRERFYRLAGELVVMRLAEERKHTVLPGGHEDSRGRHLRTLFTLGALEPVDRFRLMERFRGRTFSDLSMD